MQRLAIHLVYATVANLFWALLWFVFEIHAAQRQMLLEQQAILLEERARLEALR